VKFYVAGKWNDRRKVQAVQKILIAKGHKITVDWTIHVNPKDQSILQEWAVRDIEGVQNCDTYIGVFNNTTYHYTGALVEMGTALGLGKRIWLLGNGIASCIFLTHPLITGFSKIKTMLEVLDNIPKE